MMNMQGSFWSAFGVRFGGGGSGIDEILEKDGCTLEDVLDHEDVIQECKYMNAPLIEFLSTKESVDKLIRHVIGLTPPAEKSDKKNEKDEKIENSKENNSHDSDEKKEPEQPNSANSSTDSTSNSSNSNASATPEHESENESEALSSVFGDDAQSKKNNAIKYPYIASELFACEVVTMLDILFDHSELLDLLFSFLDQPAPIDPSNAAYFRKVVVVLIQRKYDALVKYIQSKKIIDRMVEHIGLYSVMELLIMIGWDDGLGQVQDTDWLFHQNLVPKLVAKLSPQFESLPDVHMNAARALVDVVVKCPPTSSSKLVSHLQSTSILKTIFEHMFSGSASSLTNTLSIIIVLVQRYATRRAELGEERADQEAEKAPGEGENANPESATHVSESSSSPSSNSSPESSTNSSSSASSASASTPSDEATEEPFTALLPHLKAIMDLLSVPPVEKCETQFGVATPFGETRMKVVELVLVLLRSHVNAVDKELVRLKVLPALLQAFFDYPWNNMLHGLVESIIRTVLDSDSNILKDSLFQDGQLVDKFIKYYDYSEKVCLEKVKDEGSSTNKGDGFRLGYMGHLIRTSQAIEEICNKHDNIRNALLADAKDRWNDFINVKIVSEQKRQASGAPFAGQEEDIDGMQLDAAQQLLNQHMGLGGKDGHGDDDSDQFGGFHDGDGDENENDSHGLSGHDYEYHHNDEHDTAGWPSTYDFQFNSASHIHHANEQAHHPFGDEEEDHGNDSDENDDEHHQQNNRANAGAGGANHQLVSFSMSGLDEANSSATAANASSASSSDDFDPRASASSASANSGGSRSNEEFEKGFDPFGSSKAANAVAANSNVAAAGGDDFQADFPPAT